VCGIAGVVAFGGGGGDLEGRARAMGAALAHRGPDGRGLWCDGRAALEHTRLAMLDREGGKPSRCRSRDGRYTIVYNGEVYNHVELRRRAIGRVSHALGRGDGARGVRRPGASACFTRLNGMFAFFVWDAEPRRRLRGARSARGQAARVRVGRPRVRLRLGGARGRARARPRRCGPTRARSSSTWSLRASAGWSGRCSPGWSTCNRGTGSSSGRRGPTLRGTIASRSADAGRLPRATRRCARALDRAVRAGRCRADVPLGGFSERGPRLDGDRGARHAHSFRAAAGLHDRVRGMAGFDYARSTIVVQRRPALRRARGAGARPRADARSRAAAASSRRTSSASRRRTTRCRLGAGGRAGPDRAPRPRARARRCWSATPPTRPISVTTSCSTPSATASPRAHPRALRPGARPARRARGSARGRSATGTRVDAARGGLHASRSRDDGADRRALAAAPAAQRGHPHGMRVGVEARVPFADIELLALAAAVSPTAGLAGGEKARLREALRGVVPEPIRTRKQVGAAEGPGDRAVYKPRRRGCSREPPRASDRLRRRVQARARCSWTSARSASGSAPSSFAS
jgi:asparagine synthase (glutamine-hydrolysing)